MNISNITFENNVFLAPMAGVTDLDFRCICKEMGCGLVYTEMVSAKALFYGSENTKELLKIDSKETPVAVQIFGNDPLIMAKVVEHFNNDEKICIIDINMGCPAPKIVKNGEGSALMTDADLAFKIVKEVSKASIKPVTVKIRKGFKRDENVAVDFAKRMEEAGAKAVTIHGRTREQMYEGKADWDIIRCVKENLVVPVIGNGDIFSPEDAEAMINITHCDAVMVARGSLGNPWIFRQIIQKLKGEPITYPSDREKLDLCIKHYKMAMENYNEDKAVREMRKHIAWYVKGIKNCTEIKNKINMEKSSLEVIKVLEEYKSTL